MTATLARIAATPALAIYLGTMLVSLASIILPGKPGPARAG
jgi:hypothetical protein